MFLALAIAAICGPARWAQQASGYSHPLGA